MSKIYERQDLTLDNQNRTMIPPWWDMCMQNQVNVAGRLLAAGLLVAPVFRIQVIKDEEQ